MFSSQKSKSPVTFITLENSIGGCGFMCRRDEPHGEILQPLPPPRKPPSGTSSSRSAGTVAALAKCQPLSPVGSLTELLHVKGPQGEGDPHGPSPAKAAQVGQSQPMDTGHRRQVCVPGRRRARFPGDGGACSRLFGALPWATSLTLLYTAGRHQPQRASRREVVTSTGETPCVPGKRTPHSP